MMRLHRWALSAEGSLASCNALHVMIACRTAHCAACFGYLCMCLFGLTLAEVPEARNRMGCIACNFFDLTLPSPYKTSLHEKKADLATIGVLAEASMLYVQLCFVMSATLQHKILQTASPCTRPHTASVCKIAIMMSRRILHDVCKHDKHSVHKFLLCIKPNGSTKQYNRDIIQRYKCSTEVLVW